MTAMRFSVLILEIGELKLVHTEIAWVVNGSCWKLGQDLGLTPLWGDMGKISCPDTLHLLLSMDRFPIIENRC